MQDSKWCYFLCYSFFFFARRLTRFACLSSLGTWKFATEENSLKMSQSGRKPGRSRSKGKSKADSFVWTDDEVELLLKLKSNIKSLRPRKMSPLEITPDKVLWYSSNFRQRMQPDYVRASSWVISSEHLTTRHLTDEMLWIEMFRTSTLHMIMPC